MVEQNPNEPDNTSEYSGPYAGDERDPQPLVAGFEALEADLQHREDPLTQARLAVVKAKNDLAAGKATEAEVTAAEEYAQTLEDQSRKLQPPEA